MIWYTLNSGKCSDHRQNMYSTRSEISAKYKLVVVIEEETRGVYILPS